MRGLIRVLKRVRLGLDTRKELGLYCLDEIIKFITSKRNRTRYYKMERRKRMHNSFIDGDTYRLKDARLPIPPEDEKNLRIMKN